jgi:hypothetical protein
LPAHLETGFGADDKSDAEFVELRKKLDIGKAAIRQQQ